MTFGICRFKEIPHPSAGPNTCAGDASEYWGFGHAWMGHCSDRAEKCHTEIHQVSTTDYIVITIKIHKLHY
jgi:hypothetical protein